MTAFEFMAAAFFALVGVVCLSAAVVIVYGVAVGIYRAVKGGARNGRKYAAELKFDVYTEEYGGQKLAEVDGVRYKVLRTYRDPKNPDITELTLSDLSEATEDEEATEGGGDVGTV